MLLRRLSVFAAAGRWRWPSRSAPATTSRHGDVLDLLAALVDKSLVVVEPEGLGEARYRLLETIREYAAERLAEAGETAAVERRLRDYTVARGRANLAIGMALIPARGRRGWTSSAGTTSRAATCTRC